MMEPQGDDRSAGVFGLSKAQLRPILDAAVSGRAVRSFEVSIDHVLPEEVAGAEGNTALVTFEYVTDDGRSGQVGMFAKRAAEAEHSEALHYRYLAKQNAPIPRLYGVANGPDGREILFLERLRPFEKTDVELAADPVALKQFLAVTAHFNAVRLSSEYASHLGRQDWGMNLKTAAALLGRTARLADDGALGEECREFCARNRAGMVELADLAMSLAGAVQEMEVGLCHRDHHPRNVAYRPGTDEMLVIDLELIQLMPRFWDAGQWLGPPDEIRPLCAPRRELAKWYLECYRRHGGRAVGPEDFLRTGQMLWVTRQLCDVWWRLDAALGRWASQAAGRTKDTSQLHRHLEVLVTHARIDQA